jgi:Protein of unknown function (DUF2484)
VTLSLTLAALWALLGLIAGRLPLHDQRRRAATALIAPGIPLLGWLTWDYGPVSGLVALALGAAVLRWRLVRRTVARRFEPAE